MWGRREESDHPTPRSETTPTPPPAAVAPAVSTPAAPAHPKPVERVKAQAVIGKSLKVKGSISGGEDLLIDGEVEGSIALPDHNLTVGPNGCVQAEVNAREIIVLGRIQGNVRAHERIEIRKTGSLEGDLVAGRVMIEDGAVFRGGIDISKPGLEASNGAAPARKASAAATSADGLSENGVERAEVGVAR